MRTFSKWAGLAGLRAGYALVIPPSLVETVWKVRSYNLSVASEQAILASLEDAPLLMERVRLIVEERERLADHLRKLGFVRPYPSAGNFLLCGDPGPRGACCPRRTSEPGVSSRDTLTRRGCGTASGSASAGRTIRTG